jgi:tape measure domain-containing protein
MIVRELITRLGFSADNTALTNYDLSMKRLTDTAKNLVGIFAAGFSLRSLQLIGDETQSIEARIAQLPQTIGDVGEAFDTVANHATAARQSIKSYADFYTRVGNAASSQISSQEKLLQLTDTVSKAFVVGGLTATEQSSALLQLSQALGSGVFQGDEFRAVAEAAPQYMAELANAIGKPKEELKKLGSEGKLTSKEVIDATLKMSAVFDKKFREMPLTIGQAFMIVENKFSLMIARLNRKSKIVTTIANFIVDSFDKIGDAVSSAAESINDLMKMTIGWESAFRFAAIGIAMMYLPMIINALGALRKALLLIATNSAIRLLFGSIILMLGEMAIWLVVVGLLTESLWVYMKGGDSAIGRVGKKLDELNDKASMFLGDLVDDIKNWDKWADAGAKAIVEFLRPVENKINEFENWFKSKFENMANFFGGSHISLFGKSSIFDGGAGSPTQAAASSFFPGISKVQNNKIDNHISITVPAGTSEQQQDFISKYSDQAIRDSVNRMINGSMANFPIGE